jgi:hypothetical protein
MTATRLRMALEFLKRAPSYVAGRGLGRVRMCGAPKNENMECTMRTKILTAIVLSGFVLGIQATSALAQNATTHAASASRTFQHKSGQIDPRYYDESAGQGYAPYSGGQSQGSYAVGGFH